MEQEKIYYMVIDEQSSGPFTLDEVTLHPKLTPETLVWKPGIDNWVAAKSLPELAPAFIKQTQEEYHTPPEYNQSPNREDSNFNRFADNPQYRQDHSYQNNGYNHYYDDRHSYQNGYHNNYQNRYQNNYRPNIRTNWLPWAIIATVVGFFTSCIGAIFGIIGIVQANKANTFYAQGYDREGDASNSTARIMTIIGLIFAGIGIIALFWFGNMFSSLSNLSYL